MNDLAPIEGCPCGQPHSFKSPKAQKALQRFITELGPTVAITMNGDTWDVPRIWIAAHGLTGDELPKLATKYGWKKTSYRAEEWQE